MPATGSERETRRSGQPLLRDNSHIDFLLLAGNYSDGGTFDSISAWAVCNQNKRLLRSALRNRARAA